MKLIFKILIGIIGILIIGIITYIGIIAYSFSDMCGNKIVETKISPNQSYKIIVFERNCGATTDFSTQISILKNNQTLENESGNIFSGDSDHGKAKLNKNGLIDIKAEWLNNSVIVIEYDANTRVFENKKMIGNIKINYKKL